MKSIFRCGGVRVLSAAALALAPVLVLTPTASATPVDVNFDCTGSSPIGEEKFTLKQGEEVTAPATVAPGGALDVVIDPAPNSVPSEVNGYKVNQVQGTDLRFPVPANSTFVSADLQGGSGIGPNPTVKAEGNMITVHMDGPIKGGAPFEVPTINLHLKAGQSGAVETKLQGTSFNASVSSALGDVNVPTKCVPKPNPALATTAIG